MYFNQTIIIKVITHIKNIKLYSKVILKTKKKEKNLEIIFVFFFALGVFFSSNAWLVGGWGIVIVGMGSGDGCERKSIGREKSREWLKP